MFITKTSHERLRATRKWSIIIWELPPIACSFRADWIPVSVTCVNPCLLALLGMTEEFAGREVCKIRSYNQNLVCNTSTHSLFDNLYAWVACGSTCTYK